MYVWNPTDKPVTLRAFNGNTVQIGPKSKMVKVANIFSWQVPSFIRTRDSGPETICPTTIVKGRSPFVARKPPQQKNSDGSPFVNNRSAAQMRDFVRQKKQAQELSAQTRAAAAAKANAAKND